jgi:hypothetical protein
LKNESTYELERLEDRVLLSGEGVAVAVAESGPLGLDDTSFENVVEEELADLMSEFEQVPSYHPENLIEDIFEGLSGEDLVEDSPNDELVAIPTLEERRQEQKESSFSDELAAESGQYQSTQADEIDLGNNVDSVAVPDAEPLNDSVQITQSGVALTEQAYLEPYDSMLPEGIEEEVPVLADSLDDLTTLSVYSHYSEATDHPEGQVITIIDSEEFTISNPLVIGSEQILNGSGVINGDVVLNGTFNPGNSPGTVGLTGI